MLVCFLGIKYMSDFIWSCKFLYSCFRLSWSDDSVGLKSWVVIIKVIIFEMILFCVFCFYIGKGSFIELRCIYFCVLIVSGF